MHLTVEIPDDIAIRLAEAGGDLSRRALEGLALEELRAGRITETQLRKMLGRSGVGSPTLPSGSRSMPRQTLAQCCFG
jgi:hypothetical protein